MVIKIYIKNIIKNTCGNKTKFIFIKKVNKNGNKK